MVTTTFVEVYKPKKKQPKQFGGALEEKPPQHVESPLSAVQSLQPVVWENNTFTYPYILFAIVCSSWSCKGPRTQRQIILSLLVLKKLPFVTTSGAPAGRTSSTARYKLKYAGTRRSKSERISGSKQAKPVQTKCL